MPSAVLKSVVMENQRIAAQKKDAQRQSRYSLLRGAVGFSLTGLLLWQLTQLYGESRRASASQAELLLRESELNRLQALQPSAIDAEWGDSSRDNSFKPQQMKYVVEAARSMHKQSILFPAACLLRIQEIKANMPALELNRIEWRNANDEVLPQFQKPANEALELQLQLQLQLSGHIAENLSPESGLQLFESFLQSLLNGFSLKSADAVQYPFDADPQSQIRGVSANTQAAKTNKGELYAEAELRSKASTAFDIKVTVTRSSVSELILMVESLVPEL